MQECSKTIQYFILIKILQQQQQHFFGEYESIYFNEWLAIEREAIKPESFLEVRLVNPHGSYKKGAVPSPLTAVTPA